MMGVRVAQDAHEAVLGKSDVSSVLLNLKKSAAAMLQEKERSQHSEAVWRERLNEREARVVELEHVVHAEQQKSAAMTSTMEERVFAFQFKCCMSGVCHVVLPTVTSDGQIRRNRLGRQALLFT